MNILIKILKITSLALLFAIIFNFANAYINNEITTIPSSVSEIENKDNIGNNNKYNFAKSNSILLAKSGVALSTNVGIKYKQRQTQNLYKDVPAIAKTISEKKYADNTNISNHLLQINEYYNVLKTDVKKMISSSYNKRETLEAYIEQLKYRYTNSNNNIQILLKKKSQLSIDLTKSSEKINKLKTKIDFDFRKFNADETNKNIDELLIAKAEYNYAKTHIIFINQYIKQYYALNNSNKKLLDTLINNKNAIIKNTKIVIPDTGIEGLRKLNLIVDEK
ncbi:MAG: hypothetical protein Q9M94_07100 [Candidatus Gracilibacteria bacterium]|nr:hypothetical protein [Candidatus Gracilibacteria bacterium]MDQ7022475.1 hypothetical protein [Candidatus Gracilibacteria bacterium]